MKTALLVLVAFSWLIPGIFAQEAAPSPPPAEPASVLCQLEIFTLPRQTVADLLFDKPLPAEYDSIRKQLHEMVREKKASLAAIPAILCEEGARSALESSLEVRYPTEFEPPYLLDEEGKTTKKQIPAPPTSFETRNCGVNLEMMVGVDRKNNRISFDLLLKLTAFQKLVVYPSAELGKITGSVEQPFFIQTPSKQKGDSPSMVAR